MPIDYEKYMRGLLSVARRYAKDTDDADDLLQDSLLRALEHEHLYEDQGKPFSWLCRIVFTTFINRTHNQAIMRDRHDGTAENMPSLTDPNAINTDLSDMYAHVMELLKDNNVDPYGVLLRYASGYLYKEIAEEDGVVIGTVKSRVMYARKALKERLKTLGYEF